LRFKLIENFVKNNKEKSTEITIAIKTGDTVLAHRLAHTLAGNAGQLEKTGLQNIAENIENQLKDGSGKITEDQLMLLENELNEVLAEFTSMLQQNIDQGAEAPVAMEPIDMPAITVLFEELEPLLQRSDSECLAMIDKLHSVPGSEKLIQLMENFEFDSAYDELLRLKEN